MGRLEGRVALVTGASRGIGLAVAERFAREGARVCLTDTDGESASRAAAGLVDEGMDALGAKMDVTSRTEVESVFRRTVERYGTLDILVNNAGITRDNLLFRMTDEDWRSVLNVHLTGSFFCAREAQRYMVAGGYGRIVNLSSVSALGNRGQANYAAAKAGVQGFTKTLAVELGRYGITVNAVAPGFIETEMTRQTAERMGIPFEDFVAAAVEGIPAGRSGKPDDVASAVLFFASEESAFVNGQVLYVAGGPRD
ncbi:Dehydrogenases with different specificities (related to short-chain alcohol dehydrogenases) [Rubrobacter radiotolerans]|uniref:3-oxoacyl-ACP reductase FabG n=1 Tax=Rubrobacter radiotolerans TaxID=42256 RepID=A0A023X0N2_RUBRA|nr:3-oxoacyl-ACP reductase FabG [Rubrobacter radiotolerans]AHY45908.1 Dehydrogenases with different specificities (related to short-chain alcohol dehydrogenases) [Rubrobacter radiotolerans]MDX5893322.1 3-oxoacyl-ACP reductase FabG [Rubrobacter radiotolerans]SMC03502.1 3-oxoacyl-[acyl-carrier-protein] reductase [Rubrobacter radiotolerans DSM 5868]